MTTNNSNNDLMVYDRMADPDGFVKSMGLAILHSEMFGCTNASQGAVLALECMARRVPPMTLAERYHIIHGRLSMRADAMLASFRTECGGSHKIIQRTAEVAEIELTANGQVQRFKLTWEEARQEPFVYVGKEASIVERLAAGRHKDLMLKSKYATPRSRSQMLWARVVSDGVRAMAPEVVAGYYCPEEIEDMPEPVVEPPRNTVIGTVVEATTTTAAKPAKPASGVRLSATVEPQSLDGNEVELNGPCSADHVDEIKELAQDLEMPPDAIKAMVERRGKRRLAELTIVEAEQVISKLKTRKREDEIPF